MKCVRVVTELGIKVRDIEAKDLDSGAFSLTKEFTLRCAHESCDARFAPVARHARHENTGRVRAHFRRLASSAHAADCPFNFVDREESSSREKPVLLRDGKYHVRANFPMGGAPGDLHPRQAKLTRATLEKAEKNTGKIGVSSMEDFLKILREEFKSTGNPALQNLIVYYQGHAYDWPSLFVGAQRYHRLFEDARAKPVNADSDPVLAVVKIKERTASNQSNRPRFICEASLGVVDGYTRRIIPTLVVENDEMAKTIKAGDVYLVAVRPFVTENNRLDPGGRSQLSISLYAPSPRQFAPLPSASWQPNSVPWTPKPLVAAP